MILPTNWSILYLHIPVLVTVLVACVPINKQWVNTPPLAQSIATIQKGRSTRDDVVRHLGTPHLEALGGETKVSRLHPAIRSLDESNYKPSYYSEILNLWPYSSITDDRIALVYFESRGAGAVALWGSGKVSASVNRLLIFINRETGFVEEVFFREEFKAN